MELGLIRFDCNPNLKQSSVREAGLVPLPSCWVSQQVVSSGEAAGVLLALLRSQATNHFTLAWRPARI